MQRRGFLSALLGLAATPVLAKLGFEMPTQGIVAPRSIPRILPTLEGIGRVISIDTQLSCSVTSGLPVVRLLRGSGQVLDQIHCSRRTFWIPQPMYCPVFTPDSPLVLDAPDGVDVSVIYQLEDGGIQSLLISDGKRFDVPFEANHAI